MPKAEYQARASATEEKVTSAPDKNEEKDIRAPEETAENTQTAIENQPAGSEQETEDISQKPTQTIRNPAASAESTRAYRRTLADFRHAAPPAC